MWIFISLLTALIATAIAYIKHVYSYWERRGIPYEQPIFPLGNFKGIGKTVHLRDINERIYKRFKGTAPYAGRYFMFKKSAILMDLELIRHVMIKDFANFRDRGAFSNVEDEPLSGHLFSLDGEQWQSLRTKLSPVFTTGKMKYMFPTIVEVSKHFVEVCDQSLADDLDFKELCARFTTDVIGTCAFGLECNSLKNPDAEFRIMGRRVFDDPPHSQIVQAFIFTNPQLARRLHLKFFADDVTAFFLKAVRSTVDYRIQNKIKRNDFMDMLIELKAQDEAAARKGKGIDLSHGLTLEQLAAQAFVFFVAGFDTTSSTMAFCLYELALNQQIQDKLRLEIKQVLARHNDQYCYEAMNEMRYLEQVLAETLRKYSVLPHLTRQALRDYKLPNSQHIIEAGTTLVIPIASIQHDAAYFPEPLKFDPTRFEPEEIAKRHPMSYMPFGDGPRNCIGMRFGKMQAKVGLVQLLRSFKFLKSTRTEIPIELDKRNFAIAAKNGVHLKIEKL